MGKTLADEQEQDRDQDKGRGTHSSHVQMQIRPEHVKEIVTSGNVSRAAPDVGQGVLGGWRAGLWPTLAQTNLVSRTLPSYLARLLT